MNVYGTREEFEYVDPTRLWMEVVTESGWASTLEWRFRMDTVELWQIDRCRGVFDRSKLRCWLADPLKVLTVDEVMLSLDRAVDHEGRVAITLPGVRAWTLAPKELANLRSRVGGIDE